MTDKTASHISYIFIGHLTKRKKNIEQLLSTIRARRSNDRVIQAALKLFPDM